MASINYAELQKVDAAIAQLIQRPEVLEDYTFVELSTITFSAMIRIQQNSNVDACKTICRLIQQEIARRTGRVSMKSEQEEWLENCFAICESSKSPEDIFEQVHKQVEEMHAAGTLNMSDLLGSPPPAAVRKSNYMEALETRIRWWRWTESGERGRYLDYIHDAAPLRDKPEDEAFFAFMLSHGETYYVTEHFCQMVDHLRRTIPPDLAFDPTWLLSQQGWMFIASPFEMYNKLTNNASPYRSEHKSRVRAVAWSKLLPLNTTRWIENRYQFGFYVSLRDELDEAVFPLTYFRQQFPQGHVINSAFENGGYLGYSWLTLDPGDKVDDKIREVETSALEVGIPTNDPDDPSSVPVHEIRWLFTALHLMSQKLAVTTPASVNRSVRRRVEQTKPVPPIPSLVQVITLRRLEQQLKKGQSVPVDWQWRWMVGWHWRKQYFPSTGEHKYIIIDSYMKGPDDKPVKPPASRIYVARR